MSKDEMKRNRVLVNFIIMLNHRHQLQEAQGTWALTIIYIKAAKTWKAAVPYTSITCTICYIEWEKFNS